MSATPPTRDGVQSAGAAMPPRERLREILESGLRAPSAENKHYLRFEIGADRLRLVSTDAGTWAEQPHRRMLALLAYGAVVENMTLRSAQLGWTQDTRWWPEPALPALVAQCRWSPAQAVDDRLARAIADRHTHRGFYRRAPVAEEVVQRLSQAAAVVPGASVVWLTNAEQRRTALRAIRLAETERFKREALHRELFGAIDFAAGWRASLAEGLSPGALEVEAPLRLPFASLRHWPLMRALTWVGAHHGLGLRAAALPSRLSPLLGLVTCQADDASMATVLAGRALERLWLAATAERLALQPMAAATVLARQRPGNGWVSAPVQRQLRDSLGRLTGGHPERAFMLVRIGEAKPSRVVAGRPPVDAFIG